MQLQTTGRVLGTRQQFSKKTGEQMRNSLLDLYTDTDGPVVLQIPAEMPVPEAGSAVSVTVQVRAYNGFTQLDDAGRLRSQSDPSLNFTVTRLTEAEGGAVPAPRAKAKAAA
jgi:hypothetical protein